MNLTFRKLLYLRHHISQKERRLYILLLIIVIFSLIGIFSRIYLRNTKAVPQIGGHYTEGVLGEPRTINPILAIRDTDRDITNLIYSGLFTYDGNGNLVNDLAESYEIDEDGKNYTINLRQNVFWHDQEQFDAEDVIFTIRTIQNIQYKSPLRANWQGVDVEEIDRFKIKFTLKTSYTPFIENMTVGILPKHLWERIRPEQTILHELNLKPVGTGPYRFDSLKQRKDGTIEWYLVERYDQYYQEGPYLKTIKLVFFNNSDDLLLAWKKEEIEGFGPIFDLKTIEQNKNHNILTLQMPRVFGLFFNQDNPLLKDDKIRTAIAHALNKKEIAQSAVSGGTIPYNYPLPPLITKSSDTFPFSYDPEKSRNILSENNWTDEDNDGVREKLIRDKNKNATTTPLKFVLTTSDWPDLLRAAESVKTDLKEVGIEISIEALTLTDLETNIIKPRNFDMLLFGQVYGYEPDPFPFWHSSQIKDPGLNISNYINKEADKLMEEARRAGDPFLRDEKYAEFQQILIKDLPAIFLYSQLYLYLLPQDLKGVEITKISLPSARFNEVNKWYRDTKRILK